MKARLRGIYSPSEREIKRKAKRLKKHPGISLARAYEFWIASGGKCQACRAYVDFMESARWHMCKECKRVSGVLCAPCHNSMSKRKHSKSMDIEYMKSHPYDPRGLDPPTLTDDEVIKLLVSTGPTKMKKLSTKMSYVKKKRGLGYDEAIAMWVSAGMRCQGEGCGKGIDLLTETHWPRGKNVVLCDVCNKKYTGC
jgi:hypothetical protein